MDASPPRPLRPPRRPDPTAAPTEKPLLRGWIHLVTAPLAVVAGAVLVTIAPSGAARTASAVFATSAVLLFTVSAVYHRGRWTPAVSGVLRRLDHSAIGVVIAGTYTPFAVLLLPPRTAVILLSVVWAGAVGIVLFRTLWFRAPRWLYTPLYILLGWAAVWFLPQFHAGGGAAVLTFVVVGGVLYTVGALAYALRRPDPLPRVFGYHEVFHAFTVAAFAAHVVGVAMALDVTAPPGAA
ncbi:MAG: hemolysin III family protein [Kineosporiaceae bacterium]